MTPDIGYDLCIRKNLKCENKPRFFFRFCYIEYIGVRVQYNVYVVVYAILNVVVYGSMSWIYLYMNSRFRTITVLKRTQVHMKEHSIL